MSRDKQRSKIVALIDSKTKVLGPIALVINCILLATLPLLPMEQLIFGLIIGAIVLVVTLIGMIMVELAETKIKLVEKDAHDHDKPDSVVDKVAQLRNLLVGLT